MGRSTLNISIAVVRTGPWAGKENSEVNNNIHTLTHCFLLLAIEFGDIYLCVFIIDNIQYNKDEDRNTCHASSTPGKTAVGFHT